MVFEAGLFVIIMALIGVGLWQWYVYIQKEEK